MVTLSSHQSLCVSCALSVISQAISCWFSSCRREVFIICQKPHSWLQSPLARTMAKTLGDHLLNTLEELLPYDFEKFKLKLQNTSLEKGHSRIPRGHMQMARPVKLAELLLKHYGEEYAVRLTLQILLATNQRQLAEELRKATGPGK